jgi:hypothetical protein
MAGLIAGQGPNAPYGLIEFGITAASCKSLLTPHFRHSEQTKRDPKSRDFDQFCAPVFAVVMAIEIFARGSPVSLIFLI